MNALQEWLQLNLNLSREAQFRLAATGVILIMMWALRALVLHLIERRYKGDARSLYTFRKLAEYSIAALGFGVIGRLWLENVQSFATYFGLVSAGVAIALQDLIVNLAGWLFVLWRRPFTVGDRIQIGLHAGDVIDIRLFEFTMLEIGQRIKAEQSTGRVLHIPNGMVFREALANYNQGLPLIWNEIPVLITFESDWQKAKQILFDIISQYMRETIPDPKTLQQIDRRFVISYSNLVPTVYTEVGSSGVLLTMRYMVDPRLRRNSENWIWEKTLKAFAPELDIDFAYDTRRQYTEWHEGKKARMTPDKETPAAPKNVKEDELVD